MEENLSESAPGWGLLLVNLGTPETPDRRGVARFLRSFLSDSRVVDLPRWLWLPLLNLVIIPLRAARVAAAYRSIWKPEGSPLLVFTLRLAAKLSAALPQFRGVVAGVRYGRPSIRSALEELRKSGASELIILPLFPQFSYTTTASVYDAVQDALQNMHWQPRVLHIEDYHQDATWVAAVAGSITCFRKRLGTAEKLLFSLHGIPQRYGANGDPYEQQCRAGCEIIAKAAGLKDEEWLLTFQSRVGREPWLQPYTEDTLRQLAGKGVRKVQVICPGFAVDCLETLEEIGIRNYEMFKQAGGTSLEYIPALNDSDEHIVALRAVVLERLKGLPEVEVRHAAKNSSLRV
ncbi:MAG: ferrochelatase [Lysobacterales bacterium]